MTASENIKTIDNKIERNKAWYNLDRQTAKILALSSGNADNHEFLKSEKVLLKKRLSQQAAAIKRFEYSP